MLCRARATILIILKIRTRVYYILIKQTTGQTTELYKGENNFSHAYKCSNLAGMMRIKLEATSVRIGTEVVERTGIEKFTSTHRHFAFLPCLLGARAIGQPWLRHSIRFDSKHNKNFIISNILKSSLKSNCFYPLMLDRYRN